MESGNLTTLHISFLVICAVAVATGVLHDSWWLIGAAVLIALNSLATLVVVYRRKQRAAARIRQRAPLGTAK